MDSKSVSQTEGLGGRGTERCPAWSGSSFRDPAGHFLKTNGRLLRLVSRAHRDDLDAFLSSPIVRQHVDAGHVVPCRMLGLAEAKEFAGHCLPGDADPLARGDVILEHERISFPSYPYEWPPEMLEAAGRLTLELAESLLANGLGLKDATPYNVLFRGPEPVFVDVLSIERRDPLDPLWVPYAQFVRTFLLPLVVHKRLGIPLESLLLPRREGLEPEEVYRLCGPLAKLRPPILTLVSLPTWLGSRRDHVQIYRKWRVTEPERARYILRGILSGLCRQLTRIHISERACSRWSNYLEPGESYTEQQLNQKIKFIDQVFDQFKAKRVLDAGSNTGLFTLRAARAGASVVAIDSDSVVVGRLWRQAHAERLDVLPLVVNLARPSPAVGWRNGECLAFLDRARGAFDVILLLALLHHLLVTERIPVEEILDLCAELTTDLAVIEYVGPDDPMFKRLLRGRAALYERLTPEAFEAAACTRFHIVRFEQLRGSSRRLYLLRKDTSRVLTGAVVPSESESPVRQCQQRYPSRP